MDFEHLTVKELREKLDSKEVSAVELTKAYLERIAEKDPEIKSFLTVCEDSALKQAEAAQKKIDAGEATALTGIPFGIKDNICTEGVKTVSYTHLDVYKRQQQYRRKIIFFIQDFCELVAEFIGQRSVDNCHVAIRLFGFC